MHSRTHSPTNPTLDRSRFRPVGTETAEPRVAWRRSGGTKGNPVGSWFTVVPCRVVPCVAEFGEGIRGGVGPRIVFDGNQNKTKQRTKTWQQVIRSEGLLIQTHKLHIILLLLLLLLLFIKSGNNNTTFISKPMPTSRKQ